jgi:hypothetical protein
MSDNTDHVVTFRYEQTLKDSYDSVKHVEITCRSLNEYDILDAFTEFCASLGLTMRGEVQEYGDEDDSVH